MPRVTAETPELDEDQRPSTPPWECSFARDPSLGARLGARKQKATGAAYVSRIGVAFRSVWSACDIRFGRLVREQD